MALQHCLLIGRKTFHEMFHRILLLFPFNYFLGIFFLAILMFSFTGKAGLKMRQLVANEKAKMAVDVKEKCLSGDNSLCEAMITLHKKFPHQLALDYSNLFYKYSKIYDIDPVLLMSIAFQESRFQPDAIRRGVFEKKFTATNGQASVTGEDFCMMQINHQNIGRRKISAQRLLSDVEYCIKTGAKILSEFRNIFSSKEKNWWTRYNSGDQEKRELYRKLVMRHMNKIDKIKRLQARMVVKAPDQHLVQAIPMIIVDEHNGSPVSRPATAESIRKAIKQFSDYN